jgi:hypothetical protein
MSYSLPPIPLVPYVRPTDELDIDINPATGELNLVTDFNTDRILTSDYIHTGQKRVTYDLASGTFFEDNPVVVVDNNGNVVKV